MNKLSELEVCDFDWEIVIVFIEILTRKVVFMICCSTYCFMNEKNQQYNFPNQKSEYRMHVIVIYD